jgi:glutamate-1-semialdehyde 2,1-aminomutase
MPHRVGFIPATAPFIAALRAWTQQHGALLVFDEVITYRSNYGGAQEWYAGRPDLTALGKMIGGGFPVGALSGRAEVMEVLNPLAEPVLFPHSGTFSANPVTMTATKLTASTVSGTRPAAKSARPSGLPRFRRASRAEAPFSGFT